MAAFTAEWPQARIAAHHELRGYSGREGYRCPILKDLDDLRQAARKGAAIGCRSLSDMTKRTPPKEAA
jgi:hypothetical protein